MTLQDTTCFKRRHYKGIEELLDAGIVEESSSDCEKKRTGANVDYRKLNSATNFDAYPTPRIGELLDSLST